MKFNLKTFLILICVVGATFGIMTRLLLSEPETFVAVLRFGAAVVPFALAVGTIIWIGVRGARPGRGLVIWGCALLLAPVVTIFAVAAILPSGNPLRLLSTQRLISNRLPSQADAPWVWQELEQRLVAGDLTNQNVDNAIAALTAHMKRTSPAAWNQPFHWQRGFLQQAIQRGMISEPVFLDLCDAFFGPAPTVKIITPMLNEDDTQFEMQVEYGSPWADNSGLAVQPVWELKRVLLDGAPVTLKNVQKVFSGRQASPTVEAALSPGEHQFVVELDCAFVDAAAVAGTDLDTLTRDEWPKPRKQWNSTVTVPLQVAPAAESEGNQ